MHIAISEGESNHAIDDQNHGRSEAMPPVALHSLLHRSTLNHLRDDMDFTLLLRAKD